ncbi:DNA cytosine methyltransferase [Aeromicrobium sp. UC242_57]
MSNLTLTDLFCGAGGSSTGALSVPGVSVRLAANHWDLAIETHNANHPNTDHLQADISQTDPRYIPTTDMLWASPECTNHSRAKGKKKPTNQPDLFGDILPDAAAERSRATMWDVVRFTEVHKYRGIMVENVVEVVDWLLWDAWITSMHALGYDHRVVSMSSMHAQSRGLPAPQARDRVYVVFWLKGERAPDLDRMQRPKAWCPSCDELVDSMQTWKRANAITGRYRQQYVYRCPKHWCRGQIVEPGWLPALSFIDLSNTGTRLGDRAKPLAEKTMRRIKHGVEKFWAPLLIETANGYDAADPKHPRHMDPASYWRAWAASDPVRTMHTSESKGLVLPPLAVPVEGREGKMPWSTDAAMRTMTTRSETALMMPPLIGELRGGGSTARLASDALATVTASGNHHALITSYYGSTEGATSSDSALPTVTTHERHALVMRMNNNPGADQSSMTTDAREPVRTVTTTGHQAVMTGRTINLDDIRFRMLEPSEIKQAMAFPADYEMRGNRREQVKLSGNAVTPPAARDLIACVAEAITGEAA